jgi:Clp protease
VIMGVRSGDLFYRANGRARRHKHGFLLIIGALVLMTPGPARAETFEFEGPYAVRVLHQGSEIEISGTFSWALPQQVGVALAEAPQARLVRLESPGGHIKAALEVADMIHARNLDTYVGRMCASACTIAFLAGHQRFATDTARLGFHQAHGPGLTPADSNLLLRLAYHNYSLPPAFIAHVLRTPPQDLWVPDLAELRRAGVVTDIAPTGAVAASVASGPTDVHGN